MRTTDDMYTGNGHARSSAEIEHEIEETRARMGRTIEEIRKDLSPGQLVDQALHYFREGRVGEVAGSMASSVGSVVKENPMPTALVGIGLTWLAVSSYRQKSSSSSSVREPVAGRIFSATSEASNPTSELSEGQAERESRLEGAREKAHELAESARSRSHALRERAQGLSHSAGERVRHTGEMARSGAHRAREASTRTFEAQPLLVGVIAIGVGALIGALVPESASERRLMHDKRDRLLHKADEMGAQAIGRAKEKLDEGVQRASARLEQGQQGGPGRPGGSTEGNIPIGESERGGYEPEV
jgi:ElaB/YqjD/DUF883 family membrane-anchored ribosome-binding protein